MNAMNLKISSSWVKSIYTGIHVYMPVAKNYKIAFIIVWNTYCSVSYEEILSTYISIKNDCLFTIFKIQYTLDVIF